MGKSNSASPGEEYNNDVYYENQLLPGLDYSDFPPPPIKSCWKYRVK